MPDVAGLFSLLANAAGWVVGFIVLVLVCWALVKGWLVPRPFYDREVRRGDRAEDAVEASTRSTDQAAAATRSATETALSVAGRLASIERRIAQLGVHDDPS